jgi:uncharacterized protein (TIGR02271 family)
VTTNGQDYAGWIGHTVQDSAGDKVGKVSQIYVDDRTGQPTWLSVKTGLLGNSSSFVPLADATADGDTLVIPFDKDKVKGAPSVDDDADGHLEVAEEEALYRYYGQAWDDDSADAGTAPSMTDEPVVAETTSVDEPVVAETQNAATTGYDTSGPTTDDAMTRSEEELRVGTRVEERGRARLRKYVVTENVTTTVPVSHEEVRIEREPITDANVGAATDGPAISEEEHEVVLHEERPVVEKTVVPKERVRLGTEQVTGEEQVSEQVRKEVIEGDGAGTDVTEGDMRAV